MGKNIIFGTHQNDSNDNKYSALWYIRFLLSGEKERTKEEKTLIIAQGDRTLSISIKDLNYKFELNINLQVKYFYIQFKIIYIRTKKYQNQNKRKVLEKLSNEEIRIR